MKRVYSIIFTLFLLTGCATNTSSNVSSKTTSSEVSHVQSSAVSSSTSSIVSSESANSKSSEPIYATNGEVTLGARTFAVEVVQTEAIAPDMGKYPLCAAVGRFDLVVRNVNGGELYRQNLNELYDNKYIGYWGIGPKDEDKMHFLTNQDKTKCVFGVIAGHGQDGSCIMFSLDESGALTVLPVEGGYAHSDSMRNAMNYGDNATITHFENVLNGDKYDWDGSKFVLTPKS